MSIILADENEGIISLIFLSAYACIGSMVPSLTQAMNGYIRSTFLLCVNSLMQLSGALISYVRNITTNHTTMTMCICDKRVSSSFRSDRVGIHVSNAQNGEFTHESTNQPIKAWIGRKAREWRGEIKRNGMGWGDSQCDLLVVGGAGRAAEKRILSRLSLGTYS